MVHPTLSEKQQGYGEQFDVEGLNFFRRLLSAIQNNEFVVYFQPKVSISDMKIAGAEALVRWNCDGQILPPVKFIPFCERTGLVIDVDFYVLEETCKRMRAWMNAGIELVRVSVNFSKYHFNEPGVAERIFEVVKRYGIPTEYLEVEFTETAYLDKEELLENTVEKLKSYGIKSSIDDFGSGYSSLNLLQNMDFEVVKLDKSLLGKGVENGKAKKVISSIIHMAKELEMEVLAEGVETPEEYNLLKELKCDIVQGFLFDKPLPSDEFERRLRGKYYPKNFKWEDNERALMELQDNSKRLEELRNKEREELAKEYFANNRYMTVDPNGKAKGHSGMLIAGIIILLIAISMLAITIVTAGRGFGASRASADTTEQEKTYTIAEVDAMVNEAVEKAQEDTRASVEEKHSKDIREAAELYGGMVNYLRALYPDELVFVNGYKFDFIPIDRTLKQSTVEASRFVTDKETGYMYYTDAAGERNSYFGIDVSSFQGKIDWGKVANSGAEFAIIRCGIRGFGSDGHLVEDKYFQDNIQGALEAGLKVGVYFYTQAKDEAEAVEEADFVLDILKPYKIDGPVILDVEEASSDERIKGISAEDRTNNILAFCEHIENAGYKAMVYADVKYFTTKMEISRLEKYEKWYANYNDHVMDENSSVWEYNNPFMFPYEFKMWQYSNQGHIDGIDTAVDLNVLFTKWW